MKHHLSLPATALGTIAAALLIAAATAQAQSYPERPIRLIIPVAEGGASGLVSRRPVRGQDTQVAGFSKTSVTPALEYPIKPIRLIIPVAEGGAPGLVSRRPFRGQGAQAAGFNQTNVTLALQYPIKPIRLIIPAAEGGAPGLVSRRPVRGQDTQAAGFSKTSVAYALQYPTKPIRLIIPVAPGGGNDIVARLLAQKLTAAWGQQVVVDNRPGAATAIGAEITAKANPDGYTIMLYSVSFAINASVNRNLPFDPIRDFAPITLVARVPQILIVHPAVAAKSVAELIALAKTKPGQLNYASAGSGSSNHLAMELFSAMAGISLNHVPYKGTAPGLADLVAGHVQTMFDAIPPALPQVKSGRVRALAIVSPQRFPSLPELPTMAESGLPGFTFGSWFGIVAPARTPSAIIDKLNRELVRIVQLPEIRERFIAMGVTPLGTTPQEFAQHLQREIAQWSEVVRQRNIRAN